MFFYYGRNSSILPKESAEFPTTQCRVFTQIELKEALIQNWSKQKLKKPKDYLKKNTKKNLTWNLESELRYPINNDNNQKKTEL